MYVCRWRGTIAMGPIQPNQWRRSSLVADWWTCDSGHTRADQISKLKFLDRMRKEERGVGYPDEKRNRAKMGGGGSNRQTNE